MSEPDVLLQLIDAPSKMVMPLYTHIEALRQWIASGGTEPNWSKYPRGTRRYKRYVTKY